MRVINLYGAPSAGKSTAMLGLTYKMKMMGLSVENTPEFFKEMIYEESASDNFGGQLYVLGEQNRRLARLKSKCDFAVTDCPLPLIGYYTPEKYIEGFKDFMENLYNSYDNINYFIERDHIFEKERRVHNEEESIEISKKLLHYLDSLGVEYTLLSSKNAVVDTIIKDLLDKKIITSTILYPPSC